MKKKSVTRIITVLIIFAIFPTFVFPHDSHNFHSKKHNFPPTNDIMHYRGTRMFSSRTDFYVSSIEFEEDDDAKIKIEMKFSLQINPRSVNLENILLNGKPVPKKSKLSFSKKGNKLEIAFPLHLLDFYNSPDFQNGFFTLSVGDIKSFNNISLAENTFDELYIDCEYEYHLLRNEDGIWFILRTEDD